jgi:hypothetical protein
MNTAYFPRVDTWILPMDALQVSLEEMARDGQQGNEGVALWLGRQTDAVAEVTHVVGLRGSGVIKRPDQLRITQWLINEVTDQAIRLGASLIGQIHSHGEGYGTDLSPTDRTYGIATPYYLSIVAPDFGLRRETRVSNCGVHVFEPGLGYRRLTFSEIARRVRADPRAHAAFMLVGD